MAQEESSFKALRIGEIKEKQGTPEPLTAYANFSSIVLTPEEACLLFGERDRENPAEWSVHQKIYLSLPHIKRILIGIGNAVSQYEELFGEIKTDHAANMNATARAKYGFPTTETESN